MFQEFINQEIVSYWDFMQNKLKPRMDDMLLKSFSTLFSQGPVLRRNSSVEANAEKRPVLQSTYLLRVLVRACLLQYLVKFQEHFGNRSPWLLYQYLKLKLSTKYRTQSYIRSRSIYLEQTETFSNSIIIIERQKQLRLDLSTVEFMQLDLFM